MIGEIIVSFLAGFVVGAASIEFIEWLKARSRRRRARHLARDPSLLTDSEALKIFGGLQR